MFAECDYLIKYFDRFEVPHCIYIDAAQYQWSLSYIPCTDIILYRSRGMLPCGAGALTHSAAKYFFLQPG